MCDRPNETVFPHYVSLITVEQLRRKSVVTNSLERDWRPLEIPIGITWLKTAALETRKASETHVINHLFAQEHNAMFSITKSVCELRTSI